MCSEQQHTEIKAELDAIKKAVQSTAKKPPIDATPQISTTQPLIVDYKERRHLFLWSPNNLTLTVEDIGTLTVTSNTWYNIGYPPGFRLTPVSQSSLVPVFLRATDESTQ